MDGPDETLEERRKAREAQQAFAQEAARADYASAIDQQVRACALQYAVQYIASGVAPRGLSVLEAARDFEDYLKNGR